MSAYDPDKALLLSQAMTRIFSEFDASPSEICAAVSLALRCELDHEKDSWLRAYLITNVMKHLTMDVPKGKPVLEILRPN